MINIFGSVSNSRRKRMDNKDYEFKSNRSILQHCVAQDIKPKDHYSFDDHYDDGIKWFDSGLSLEDAPEKLRNNGSFCKGYNRGEFLSIQRKALYDEGKRYYEQGIPIDSIRQNLSCNEYFLNGYNDTKKGINR